MQDLKKGLCNEIEFITKLERKPDISSVAREL